MMPPEVEPDFDLILRSKAGDTTAFKHLIEKHADFVLRYALTFGCNYQQAEDVAQETLVEVWKTLKRFDGRCRFTTWLFGILRHRFLKSIRSQRQGKATSLNAAHSEALSHPRENPESRLEQSEDVKTIRNAVANLPEEHREVIELRFFAEASLEEIASILNIPLGTVKSRLHHGLDKYANKT